MLIAKPKTEAELRADAEAICKILCETMSEARGNLLLMVASELRKHSKSVTASFIQQAGRAYNDA